MKFYLDDKKVSKKTVENLIGKEKLKERIAETKAYYIEEHGLDNIMTWMAPSPYSWLSIEVEIG